MVSYTLRNFKLEANKSRICAPMGYLDSVAILLITSSGMTHCVKFSFCERKGCIEICNSLTRISCLLCVTEHYFEC
jgi:hypothetical protein